MRREINFTNLKRILITITAIACLNTGVALAEDTLVIGWYDWAPHQTEDKNGNLVGANIELMTALCKRAGFKAEFRKMPWKRILKSLQKGRVDIATSASKTEERGKYAYFSDTYFKLEYNVMFTKKSDKAKYSSIKSLADTIGTDFKIGIIRGSVYSDEHEELLENKQFTKNIHPVNSEKSNIAKLMKGRIDGFIADELGGAVMIKELGLSDKIEILFYLYEEKDAEAYLMFSKKSMTKAQVDKMNSALKKMKSDGSYEKLLSKYKL